MENQTHSQPIQSYGQHQPAEPPPDCPAERRRNTPSLASAVNVANTPITQLQGTRSGNNPTGGATERPYPSGQVHNPSQVGLTTTQKNPELGGVGPSESGNGNGGERRKSATSGWWTTEPRLGRVAHGVAHRVDRLKAIGNGQVCRVVELAWKILSGDAEI